MIPPQVLALASRGAFNMHGSLLPRYRGRAPTNWAVLNGETETGATLHEMVAQPDAGRHRRPERGAHPARRHRAGRCSTRSPWRPSRCSGAACRRSWTGARARACPTTCRREAISAAASPRTGASTGRNRPPRVYNLIRAVAPPYPGAFTESPAGGWWSPPRACAGGPAARGRPRAVGPACIVVDGRIVGVCGDGGGDERPRAQLRCGRRSTPDSARNRLLQSRGNDASHEEDPHPRRQRLHRQQPDRAHPRGQGLGGLRHGHGRGHARPVPGA